MQSTKIHHLKQLQEEHCWKLFAKHAFQDENSQMNPEFKEIGMKITEKCQGMPLALKTIGILLSTKSSLLEWESILASEIWDLSEKDSDIIPALMLSYRHLPSHLKRCFAYCSLFPKDYEFKKEHLILLWMAENFLKCPRKTMTMEEVGEQYFNDLRSFFQQSSRYETYFVMHDLLNDLAQYVSGDFCFRFEVEKAQNISKMTRHFSLSTRSYDEVRGWSKVYEAKRLRTFLSDSPLSSNLMHDLFSNFKFLRVLSMSDSFNITEVPNTTGNLKHLRYLDLSRTRVKKLPDSTCLLLNLQILKLTDCSYLEELPLNLHKLTNLRYLDFRNTNVKKMPMHMGKLKNLQVLTPFYVGKCSKSNIQQLGELSLHGELSILELQNIVNPLDALAANMKNKIHLVKLELKWGANHDDSQQEIEVLEKLQPSNRLRELSIWNYGGTRFPNWFGDNSLTNVVSLEFIDCEKCVLLPPLGILSSLKKLLIIRLPGIVVIGSEFYGKGSSSSSTIPFASLKTLSFWEMDGWEEWECKILTGVVFPCLEELSIDYCPEFKGHLPYQLPCLKKLTIDHCYKLVASIPWAQATDEKLQFDYHSSPQKSLKIGGHNMEPSLLDHTLSNTSLERLEITGCPNMNIFPTHHCFNYLENLSINNSCDSLRTFPLDFFPKLHELYLQECNNLEMITQEHNHNLKHLSIIECPNFVSFPKGGFNAPMLETCHIGVLDNLRSLPERMHIFLPSLTSLHIRDCPQLELFSSDGGCPPNLKRLKIRNCSSKLMPSLKWALGTNTSLVQLSIREMDVESFPDQGLLPISLVSLKIKNFPNLEKLDYKGLSHLSSLTELRLSNCPKLQCLPEEGLPKSISSLHIESCLLLKERCQKQKGQDWEKISHIQDILIVCSK